MSAWIRFGCSPSAMSSDAERVPQIVKPDLAQPAAQWPHDLVFPNGAGNRLGRPARRTGLRVRQDLSSLPAAVASGRRLAASARRAAGRTKTGPTRSTGSGHCWTPVLASFRGTGPNPTDRSKSGSKHQVMTDAQGVPLAATVTAANVNEVTQVFQVLTSMPPVGGKPGPKRRKPERLQGDRGYDSEPVRQLLRWLGITPVLAARYTESGSGLGVFRWFVERTLAWLHQFGRLRRRLDRLTEFQNAFLQLACALICLRFLSP
jgi:transposase